MTLPYDLSETGRVSSVVLLIYCAVEVVFTYNSTQYIGLINQLEAGRLSNVEMDARITNVDSFGVIVGLLLLLTVVGCFISVGMWTYRAAANAQAIMPDDARITPGWAVGWYFVPFANLVMPFRAMRQTWNGLTRNPALEAGMPGYTLAWWLLWLLGNTLSTISTRVGIQADSFDALRLSHQVQIASSLAAIIAAILLRKLILELVHASASASDISRS